MNRTKEKTAPPLRHLSDAPEVQREQAKLADLRAQMKTCAGSVAALGKRATRRGKIGNARALQEARIGQLLSGDDTPAQDDVTAQLRNGRQALREYEIAVDRQQRAVETAKKHASIEICKTVEGEYRGLSQSVIDRWFALIAAFDSYDLFLANLREENISLSSLPSLDLSKEFRQMLGTPRKPTGPLAGLVVSARRNKYTTPDA